MFLYNENGEAVGHITPRPAWSAEERQALRENWKRTYGTEPPPDPPEPLELRLGRLKDSQAQVRLEYETEAIRREKGEAAAENFYALCLAAEKGDKPLEAKFRELFPNKPSKVPGQAA
jgi:hypothetical protein